MLIDLKELMIGQTVSIPVEFLTDNDVPIPIFGSTYYFNLKDNPRTPDAQAALSVSVVFPDDQESNCGRGILVINSNDWASVSAKQYYWSAYRVVTADNPQSVFEDGSGKVNVVKALNGTF